MSKENELKIAYVKTSNLGLRGMTVGYSRMQKGTDKLPWMVTHESKYPMPIGPDIRKCFDDIAERFLDVMGYDPERVRVEHTQITRVDYTQDGSVRVHMNVMSIIGEWGMVSSPWVKIASDYEDYPKLQKACEKLWEMTAKYVLGENKVESKQYMMDLFAEAEKKNKEFDYSLEEINAMSGKEALTAMRKKLEDAGDIFLYKVDEEKELADE